MNFIIKELLRTQLKQQVVIWVLLTVVSKYMIYNGSVRTDFFYLVPYFFAASIVLEMGYSSESLFFDGISVFKKELYKSLLFFKLVGFTIIISVNFLVDFVLFNNVLLSILYFFVCIFSSNVIVYNFAYYGVRYDIMSRNKKMKKSSILSYLFAFVILFLGIFFYHLGEKQGNNFYLIIVIVLGIINILLTPFIMRSLVRKVQKNRYKLMQSFRGQ